MGVQGGIIEREAPLHVSNVAIFNPGHARRATGWGSSRSRTAARCAFSSRTEKWSTSQVASERHGSRLQQIYREKIVPELKQSLGLKNTMQVPRIIKITVNMGVGEAVADKKVMDAATADLAKITGQKPAVTKAKKSVATFKVRDGQAIGCKVTLRGARMYEFLDRLVNIAIPRIRDFRGISAALLRRPRQLQPGREGTDHFPGDPVRPDRSDPRDGHHHLDVGRGRQARTRAARSLQLSVP